MATVIPAPDNAAAPTERQLQVDDLAFAKTVEGSRTITVLKECQQKLAPYQIGFGYRIVDEVLAYLAENSSAGLLSFEDALDYQVEQKVLRKVRGRGKGFEEMLFCEPQMCGTFLACGLSARGLSRSAKRAQRMGQILVYTGFTSYDGANQ